METGRTKDGQFVIRRTGETTWTPVPQDVYSAAKAGRLEAFGRGIKEGAQDLGAGAGELLTQGVQVGEGGPNFNVLNMLPGGFLVDTAKRMYEEATGEDVGGAIEAVRTENDDRQAALREAQPVATFAGEMLPEMALGAGAKTLRGAMALDAALGAASNPDNPSLGAVTGATVGGVSNLAVRGVSRGTRKGVDMATTAIDAVRGRTRPRTTTQLGGGGRFRSDDLNAARVDDPTYERTERELRGFIEADRAEQLGFRLTPGERAALEATDADSLAKANRMRDIEDVVTSTKFTGTPVTMGDLPIGGRFARDDHRIQFTKYLGDILDEPNVDTLTPRRLGDLLSDTQQVFKDYIDEADIPIPSGDIIDDVAALADEIGPTGQTQLAKLAKDIEDLADSGEMNAQAVTSLMNVLNKRSKSAFDGGNYELGSAYTAVRNALNDAVVKVAEATSPGAAIELKLARQKYGIIKSLQRGRAVDPGGVVNPQSFRNNYAKTHRRFANGQDDSEFAQVLDTLTYLTSRQTGDSGTAARLLAAGVGSAPAGAAGVGAATAGYNSVFGQ